MPTTAGALALDGHLCDQDAVIARQLRQAGAIILAKTTLSEWANFRGQKSSSGWSALGGQAKTPHLLSHSPCGSSSGSAVAVAADFSLLAVGTETDGSIVCPSAINGIVGIKPTRGAVCVEGIIPIAHSQDIAGPMARDVYGAALLLDALLAENAQSRFELSLAQSAVRASSAKKVALIRAFDDRCSVLTPMFEVIQQSLDPQGTECVNVDAWQLPEALREAEFKVLIYEFKRDLEQWLTDYQAPESVNTMAKIIAFNQQQGEKALAFYGQEFLEQAEAIDLDADKADYESALVLSRQLAEQMLNTFLENGFDAVILPTASPSWPIDHDNGDQYDFATPTAAAVSGYPSMTIPAAFEGSLPVGVSLVGLPWSEPTLISLAANLESILNAYRKPNFLVG